MTVPALIGEVRSKNDTQAEIREKARRYVEAGTRLVWVADPNRRIVTAYRSGQEPRVLGVDELLTAEGIIPGLEFPVHRLFEGLDE